MNYKGWMHGLSFEPDNSLREYLMEGITQGFKIVDQGAKIESYECTNYNSVLKGPAHDNVDSLLDQEISEGKYIRCDTKPLVVHALGAVPKSDNTFRPITDCRRPIGESINIFMAHTHQPFNFSMVDDIADMVSPGCYMSCTDIKSAYCSVSIHPDDRKYQGISWVREGIQTYFVDTRLCFWVCCAPYIFTQISKFIVNCMSRRGYNKVVGYIDDFWVAGNTPQECQEAHHALIKLLRDLGFGISWKKLIGPSTHVLILKQ